MRKPFGIKALFIVALLMSAPRAMPQAFLDVEGGSDGDGDVYAFALFRYATAGITISF